MTVWELALLAIGLSMDAFAVALCKGLAMRELSYKNIFLTGGFYGVFQAAMPMLGFLLGTQFKSYIVPVDHWVAFGLLCFIGGKMIYESRETCDKKGECGSGAGAFSLRELTLSGIATSIDALAVGITFAFLEVRIIPASLSIGLTTFTLSCIGVRLGHAARGNLQSKAEIVGGVVLILIGTKILLEHLGVIRF
ncbi:MAG TPA: manganese efflux pump MntP family protein [Feifaniaceae bacterium]|nr:manganese efflux pump MntP family protein [Feifaniaceae bacterium]